MEHGGADCSRAGVRRSRSGSRADDGPPGGALPRRRRARARSAASRAIAHSAAARTPGNGLARWRPDRLGAAPARPRAPATQDGVPHEPVVARPREGGARRSAARYSSSESASRSSSGEGLAPGAREELRVAAAASPRAFQGQTVWQSSQPKTQPAEPARHLGRDRRRAARWSRRRCSAARPRPRAPGWRRWGRPGGTPRRSRSAPGAARRARARGRARTVPSTTQLPCSAVMRQPFFPIQPMPGALRPGLLHDRRDVAGRERPRAGSRRRELGDERA